MVISSLYSWGSGANYQLGTGSTDRHDTPLRVEALQVCVCVYVCVCVWGGGGVRWGGGACVCFIGAW